MSTENAAPQKDGNTELLILNAARKVFTQKGYAAARMEDIAREAGMNRALIHYYFRSKEKMFDLIFEENLRNFYTGFLRILSTDVPMREKIRNLVHNEIDTLLENPELPLFIVNEIARNPAKLQEKMKHIQVHAFFREFTTQFEAEFCSGQHKQLSPHQFLMSLMSMCIFPFMGKPMLVQVMGISEEQFRQVMEQRKAEVSNLLLSVL
jgi:TetR/AcrR family transcriptional regulator